MLISYVLCCPCALHTAFILVVVHDRCKVPQIRPMSGSLACLDWDQRPLAAASNAIVERAYAGMVEIKLPSQMQLTPSPHYISAAPLWLCPSTVQPSSAMLQVRMLTCLYKTTGSSAVATVTAAAVAAMQEGTCPCLCCSMTHGGVHNTWQSCLVPCSGLALGCYFLR